MRFALCLALATALVAAGLPGAMTPAFAQGTPPDHSGSPKFEMRATWMATVVNLDWPSNKFMSTDQKKSEMQRQMDRVKAAGLNAVIFQVRNEADALYASSFEPWSYFLTGEQGKAPDPYFDPLEFAVEEAHSRGLELHAWFNPYRLWVSSRDYPRDPGHLLLTRPDWVLEVGSVKIINPGIPEARQYVIDVVMDVATRYDVDGIHFDDYFYPYPPNSILNEDQDTYRQYGASFASITIWREYNVNMLVRGVWNALQAQTPHVKFGISPFGIWRSGNPPGVVGLSGKDAVFADAVNWMEQEWLDYLTPQLYWSFGGGQDFGALADWWASKAGGTHIYTGHGLYRADQSTYSGTLFGPSEIPNQIRYTRGNPDVQGGVFFRLKNVTDFDSRGFSDSVSTGLFRYPALTPSFPWKEQTAPEPPAALTTSTGGTAGVTLSWQESGAGEEVRFYAVYRVFSELEPDWTAVMADPANLVEVTGETSWADDWADAPSPAPVRYVVTAVSRNSVESSASGPVVVVSVEADPAVPAASVFLDTYPNPFTHRVNIELPWDYAGSVAVLDVLGRRVAELPGRGRRVWDGRNASGVEVSRGVYLLVAEDGSSTRVVKL